MNARFTYLVLSVTYLAAAGSAGAQDASARQPNPDTPPAEQQESNPQTRARAAQPPPKIPSHHEDVTVTATRTPSAVREVGQSVTLITREDIEAQGARDLLQVLETVPGFNVVRSGSFGGSTSVFVRGGESDFNLVLIDGLQANQAGGAFDFGDLTTTNIERIEIVRGPSSVLYGADAATSVINIITRKGEGRPSGDAKFEGGTYNSYLLRGNVQGGLERLHYSFGAHYSESDGFHDFNNRYDKTEFSAGTAFDLTSASSISTNVRHLDSKFNQPTDFTGAVLDPNDFRQTDETVFSTSYDGLFAGGYSTRIQYGHHRRNLESFTLEDGIVDFLDSTFETRENRNYLDWQNGFQLNPSNQLTAGVSYEREKSQTAALSRRSAGLYVQDQFSWTDRFFLTVGGRYENNDRFRSFTTGSVSASYLWDDQLKVRASLGNGLRAPSFLEIVGLPEFSILGNSDLDPEKNVATDFGFDFFSRDSAWGLSSTVFFNRFSDLIEFSFLVPAGTPNYINVEKARSQGVEFSGFFRATDRLRLGSQYTFTDTEVTDGGTVAGGSFAEGESLLRRPRHMAGLYTEFLKQRYKLRIDFKFKGERDDFQFFPDFSSARVKLPSYWKVDFSVTLPVLQFTDSGDLALVLRGENIFNKDYTEIAGFQSPGRSAFAGLEVAF